MKNIISVVFITCAMFGCAKFERAASLGPMSLMDRIEFNSGPFRDECIWSDDGSYTFKVPCNDLRVEPSHANTEEVGVWEHEDGTTHHVFDSVSMTQVMCFDVIAEMNDGWGDYVSYCISGDHVYHTVGDDVVDRLLRENAERLKEKDV